MTDDGIKRIIEYIEDSHNAVSRSVSGFGSDLIKVREGLVEIKTELKSIKEELKEYKDAKKEQNGRIGKLESYRSYLVGGGAIVTIIVIPLLSVIFSLQVKNVELTQTELKSKVQNVTMAVNDFISKK